MLRIHFTRRDLAITTVSIAPYRPSIGPQLIAQTEHRGVDRLLASLHPRAKWTAPVLQVLDLEGPDLHLSGRGIRLQLSAFRDVPVGGHVQARWQPPMRLLDPALLPVLIVPIRQPTGLLLPIAGPAALLTLLGATRAIALEACLTGCTTTELARRCKVTTGAASYQARVLRQAGLITTRRTGSSVLHEITLLGFHLLVGQSA